MLSFFKNLLKTRGEKKLIKIKYLSDSYPVTIGAGLIKDMDQYSDMIINIREAGPIEMWNTEGDLMIRIENYEEGK